MLTLNMSNKLHRVLRTKGFFGRTSERFLSSTSTTCKVFDVEKNDDFKKKVLQADKPVIVDFHAGYVCMWARVCMYMWTHMYV